MNLGTYQAQFFDQLTGHINSDFIHSIQCRDALNEDEQQTRMTVYLNNYAHSLSEALKETFPVVERLIGEDLFKALAIDYVKSNPPVEAALTNYGYSFISFVAAHPNCAELPFLADVAHIEWLYIQCFHGKDDNSINMNHLLEVDEDMLSHVSFIAHPNCYLLKSDYPVFEIWEANLEDEVPALNLDDYEPTRLLVFRDDELVVRQVQLQTLAYEFIESLFNNNSIEDTWQHIQQSSNGALAEEELYGLLSYFLQLPVFTNLTVSRG